MMPDPHEVFLFLIQIPITATVIWVMLKQQSESSQERKTFIAAMERADDLFTAELQAERESRERMNVKTYDTLTGLSLAISELRGEVRTSGHNR